MGACCSRDERFNGSMVEEGHKKREIVAKRDNIPNKDCIDDDDHIPNADCIGGRVRLEGSSKLVSMFSQQGRKGVNQDSMTVWENFNGEKDAYFCAVFDGHGPSGHKVSQQVRDTLPSKLCSYFKHSQINGNNDVDDEKNNNNNNNHNEEEEAQEEEVSKNPFFSSWKKTLIKSFAEMDEDLCHNVNIDTYCSGSTSVAVLRQGEHLVIANLGDSRAVLCTRGEKDQLVSVQLTVDLKPNLPSEADRIKNCEGRVFALEEEPAVFRVWMPERDCPGLAMARAFGDFCLKDFGLISTPEVFYRKLTDQDEFVVLATDGIWDVLSNNEVVKIVTSAKKRSLAARLLVDRAVRAWRHQYPTSKVDDCAVICLFLKNRPLLTKSVSEASRFSKNYSDFELPPYSKKLKNDDGLDTVINCELPRSDSVMMLSRSVSQHGLSCRRRVHDVK
ncbi:hypothetical protein ACSBR1_035207 [Camellia fascicularis]